MRQTKEKNLNLRCISKGIVAGPTGAGKGTFVASVLKKDINHQIKLSISWTTRGIRSGETAGVSYHYKTVEEFLHYKTSDPGFLECKEVHGNYYGSPTPLPEELENFSFLLFDIDVEGADDITRRFPCAKILFLDAEDEILRQRALSRNPDTPTAEIEKRLRTAAKEREWAIASIHDHRPNFCYLDSTCSPEEVEAVGRAHLNLPA